MVAQTICKPAVLLLPRAARDIVGLVRAMNILADDPKYQAPGLHVLALYAETIASIIKGGGAKVEPCPFGDDAVACVLAALQRHTDNGDLQLHGCDALHAIVDVRRGVYSGSSAGLSALLLPAHLVQDFAATACGAARRALARGDLMTAGHALRALRVAFRPPSPGLLSASLAAGTLEVASSLLERLCSAGAAKTLASLPDGKMVHMPFVKSCTLVMSDLIVILCGGDQDDDGASSASSSAASPSARIVSSGALRACIAALSAVADTFEQSQPATASSAAAGSATTSTATTATRGRPAAAAFLQMGPIDALHIVSGACAVISGACGARFSGGAAVSPTAGSQQVPSTADKRAVLKAGTVEQLLRLLRTARHSQVASQCLSAINSIIDAQVCSFLLSFCAAKKTTTTCTAAAASAAHA